MTAPLRVTGGRAPAWLRPGLVAALLPLLLAAGGCATVPPNAGSNPADPFERVNRQVYAFNDRFDRAVAKPVARGYARVVPRPLRTCVGNAFANLGEITNFVNATLQFRPADAANDAGRLLVNTTLGLAGCFDVARGMGMERSRQDFGLTLGRWGVGSGPYVVLPFMGPRSLRDAVGEVPDYFTDPVRFVTPRTDYYLVYGARFVDLRAQYLDASGLIDAASLDPYQFLRDAYLQRRRSQVEDGNGAPPPAETEDPDSLPPDVPAGSGASAGQPVRPPTH